MNTSVTYSAYPDALTMREARDHFLASNGFYVEDYSARTYTVKLGRLPIRFPNTKAHRWATPLHDLHHILTGYRTDWIGEAEIAAWELRAGCKTLLVYSLDVAGWSSGYSFLRRVSGGPFSPRTDSARFTPTPPCVSACCR